MQRAAKLTVHGVDGGSPGRLIAGVDEAGRGPLAGEVYAAAVILPVSYKLPGLNDSKKLSESRREQLFDLIQAQAVSFAIVGIAAPEIDRLNIFQATLQAMTQAVTMLATQPDFVYVDGTHCPPWAYQCQAMVQGDSQLDCIAAASILAKVARDRVMVKMDQQYPGYGFAKHKGYPTKAHMAALEKLGPCPAHRRSYAPVARCLAALNQ